MNVDFDVPRRFVRRCPWRRLLPGLCLVAVAVWNAAGGAGPVPAAEGIEAEIVDIEPVWSAHPVGFCLLTSPPHQFVAFYDAQRRMTVAQRRLNGNAWTFTRLPSTLGWDSHNYIAMAMDREGFLHLSGNMHCVPLVYFRSTQPLEAASLQRQPAMTGQREQRVTYPVFLRDREGRIVFRYRDGSSGKGDDLYNVYDEPTRTWSRLCDQPLVSGSGLMNAYCTVPQRGPDGRFHMVWVWRDTPDCATNHDLSYARSDGLRRWTDSAGRPLVLPITLQTGEVIDPVPAGGGLLNANRELGFDHQGRPVVTYHKYDAAGDLQIYAARRDEAGWRIVQVSDWQGYRWEFQGGGTIVAEVDIGAVRPIGEGRLALRYRYGRGAGTWVLDGETLQPIPGAKAPPEGPLLPPSVRKIESAFPGMLKQIRGDSGQADDAEYFLVWETLAAHRDRPREPPLPDPSSLRVVRLPR
jgi:hypothetical protein